MRIGLGLGVTSGGPSPFVLHNLLTKTEFPNGLTGTTSGGSATATTMAGPTGDTTGAVAIAKAGVTSFTYNTGYTAPVSTQHTFSAFIRMDDGLGPPVFANASPANVANDFYISIGNNLQNPLTYVTTDLGGGLYRVSVTGNSGTASTNLTGVLKSSANSDRSFKVTGYQLELGGVLTSYQRVN